MKDYTEEEVARIGMELQALIKPFVERYKIKYVISGTVQKITDPTMGTHFVLVSDPGDALFSMQSIARSAQALTPMADAQLAALKTTKH